MTQATTLHAPTVARDRHGLAAFAAGLRGRAFWPADAGYAEACRIWYAMLERRPALVVRPRDTGDVVACVRFARDSGLPLSVRGGGHNIAGTALCAGGVMIDFSTHKAVEVDAVDRARAGAARRHLGRRRPRYAGVRAGRARRHRLGDRGRRLHARRRVRLGHAPLRLRRRQSGRGRGRHRRRAGAPGERRRQPGSVLGDARGGGNFGVVTSFEFEARPHGPEVIAGLVLHPMARAKEVLALFREATAKAPDGLCHLLVMRKAPPLPIIPEEVHGAPVAGIAVCHSGPLEEGEELVAPLKRFGQPIVDTIGRKPFIAHQQFLDAGQPFGRRYYWKSDYFDALPEAADPTIIAHATAIKSPHSAVLCMHLGGAAARRPAE